MEELFELRTAIQERRYADALRLIDEMEEMSRDDKINKIDSYVIILLVHLIKQQAEHRTTPSWDLSIYNAVRQITRTNKLRRSSGHYLSRDELRGIIAEAYPPALKMATLEAFKGQYSEGRLARKVNRDGIEQQALDKIATE